MKKKPKPEPVEILKGEEPKMALTIPIQPGTAGLKREAEEGENRVEGKRQKVEDT